MTKYKGAIWDKKETHTLKHRKNKKSANNTGTKEETNAIGERELATSNLGGQTKDIIDNNNDNSSMQSGCR